LRKRIEAALSQNVGEESLREALGFIDELASLEKALSPSLEKLNSFLKSIFLKQQRSMNETVRDMRQLYKDYLGSAEMVDRQAQVDFPSEIEQSYLALQMANQLLVGSLVGT